MFRKLVSNLAFSPALITQVGFYARRLRQEEITRRLTVLFVVLAVVVQSLAVFSPPESANASSEQDLIRGGVQNIEDLLLRYDNNSDDLKDIYTAAGITRDEIVASHYSSVSAQDNIYLMSRYGQFSSDDGEVSFTYKRSAGGEAIRYLSPLALSQATTKNNAQSLPAWIGQSKQSGWFAIVKSSAGLAVREIPPTLTINPIDTAVQKQLTITNVSQNSDGTTTKALPRDKLSYQLQATNTTKAPIVAPFTIRLADTLEYTTLVDAGGATFDKDTHALIWPTVSLAPGETQTRTFVVELMTTLPTTATGKSDKASFDCILSSTYGVNRQVPVDCPAIKAIESVSSELPTTGIFINVVFSVVVFITAVYFYARTRQMKQEIRLIRHNINTGII